MIDIFRKMVKIYNSLFFIYSFLNFLRFFSLIILID